MEVAIWKKTRFVLLIAFLVTLFSLTCFSRTALAKASSDQAGFDYLDRYEANSILRAVQERYGLGDVLTEEDAAFIHWYSAEYGQLVTSSSSVVESDFSSYRSTDLRSSGSFKTSKTAFGTTVYLYGTVWHTGSLAYNYGGRVTGRLTQGPTPRRMTVTVSCTSYGILNGDTVVTYTGSVSQTSTNSVVVQMDKSANYYGFVLLAIVDTTLDVTTSGGQGFNLIAPWST